ncbi:MAG: DNA gyrase inhibitor YacG [Polyangia bacterium]
MSKAPARSVAYVCPICSTAVPSIDESTSVAASAAHRYRPFCSARCQRIDMGNWLGERYTIPSSEQQPADGDGSAKRPDAEDDSDA